MVVVCMYPSFIFHGVPPIPAPLVRLIRVWKALVMTCFTMEMKSMPRLAHIQNKEQDSPDTVYEDENDPRFCLPLL